METPPSQSWGEGQVVAGSSSGGGEEERGISSGVVEGSEWVAITNPTTTTDTAAGGTHTTAMAEIASFAK